MARGGRVVSGYMADRSPAMVTPELAVAALSCAALARACSLAEWVGPGRTLTASGVLRPAEAVRACQDLGIEVPGPRLRSALDVDELMGDWLAAAAAGFLQIDGRRARAAPDLPAAGSATPPDPNAIVRAWVQAAAAVLDLDEEPCAACLTVLHELHAADGPLTVDQLAGAVRGVLEPEVPEGAPCPGCGQVHGPGDLLGLGDLLGDEDEDEDEEDLAEHVEGAVDGLLAFGAVDTVDGAARLTPLGSVLAAAVFDGLAPSPEADAEALVSAISELPPPVARTVARPWLGARSTADAARELLAFAESADSGERLAALAFAGQLGTEATDVWQQWAKRPGIGAYARQWLRSQGEVVAEDPADEAWLAVDSLSAMLDGLTDIVPPLLLQAVLAEQAGEEVANAAEWMLGSGHPRAADVVARLTGRPSLAVARGPASGTRGWPGGSGRSGVTGRSSGQRARRPERGPLVYQLKITLRDVSKPPVWRRVLVRAGITLRDVHEVIQQAMGWENCHMHVFSTGWQEYGSPDPELGHASDKNARLSEVLAVPGDRLRYTYDFGDDWEHDIVLEEIRPAEPGEAYPVCVAGKGACPPEDCGGAWGYANLKEILARPSHEEHEETLDWLGLDTAAEFDPGELSIGEVNDRLGRLAKTR
jgi:Plasmid pRiA4b ORF-3-like protein